MCLAFRPMPPKHHLHKFGTFSTILGLHDCIGLATSNSHVSLPCLIKHSLHERSDLHSFILAISVAPLQVLYYSEALLTTARILYQSFTPKRTGNCRYRTCPRSLRGG